MGKLEARWKGADSMPETIVPGRRVDIIFSLCILVYMNSLNERIDSAMHRVMAQIASAASHQDLPALETLTNKASELKQIQEQAAAMEARLQVLESDVTNSTNSKPLTHNSRRELVVEVTQGMINQNLLTLTDHINRRTIRIGEIMTIELPDGQKFKTEIMASGNKLQERGAVGRFYRDAHIHAGERVMLSEITPGQWQLKKADMIRYKRV